MQTAARKLIGQITRMSRWGTRIRAVRRRRSGRPRRRASRSRGHRSETGEVQHANSDGYPQHDARHVKTAQSDSRCCSPHFQDCRSPGQRTSPDTAEQPLSLHGKSRREPDRDGVGNEPRVGVENVRLRARGMCRVLSRRPTQQAASRRRTRLPDLPTVSPIREEPMMGAACGYSTIRPMSRRRPVGTERHAGSCHHARRPSQ